MSNDWIPTAYRKPYGHEYYHRSPWDDIVFNKLLIAYGPNYIKHCIGFYDGENWFDQDNRLIKCVQAWMPFDGYVPVMKEKDEKHKPEDCWCYTIRSYDGQGGCLGTKEIDPCEGENCKRWRPKDQKGRWVKATGMMPPEFHGRPQCSNCGHFAMWYKIGHVELTPFCPWCGKPMELEGNE